MATLKCSNCTFETEETDLIKHKSWHACWLDKRNGQCEIIGYRQEGVLLYKEAMMDDSR